ncbi:MAG: hypothetical protein M1120_03240 [Patescibacteria group bacterium]|nr:hypothetical protein [Patescibacteria group bacterium]
MSISPKKWFKLNFFSQMANIGSEVERAVLWSNKKNKEYSKLSFFRALELLDLTITDKNNIKRLSELTRLREVLADYFYFDNTYKSKAENWSSYFYPFNYAVRKNT